MRGVFLLTGSLIIGATSAQLNVASGIQLEGTSSADRQILGLADPLSPDAAVSVDAARVGTMSFAQATGTSALIASLVPAPVAYSTGMALTIIPTSTNYASTTLDLNGLGPMPIVKWGQVPLDSADLTAGVPVRLVFDGSRFLLLNSTSRPCPSGYSAMTSTYCISDSTVGLGTFFEAVSDCAARNGRLCSFGEWANTCRNQPGFLGTLNAYEWVDDAHNNPNDAKTVGGGYAGPLIVEGFACEYGFSSTPTVPRRYRCCSNR